MHRVTHATDGEGSDGATYQLANRGFRHLNQELAAIVPASPRPVDDSSTAWAPPEWFVSGFDQGVPTPLAVAPLGSLLPAPSLSSDVYMFGGLMFEVMTCGHRPFYWIPNATQLLMQRRNRWSQNVLEAAVAARVPPPQLLVHSLELQASRVSATDCDWWTLSPSGSVEGHNKAFVELLSLMRACLSSDPLLRPPIGLVAEQLLEHAAVSEAVVWEAAPM